jgi:cytochrome P450
MKAETRVWLGAHPLAYPLIRGLARLGPVVRVPRVGIVISDADLAREVLLDTARFTKTGPGSPADLWTPVVGPTVLLNMEGAPHTQLRRKLAGLFTPRAVQELCARVAGEQIAGMRSVLDAGGTVDVVAEAQHLAGAVIAELVGLEAGHSADAFAAATAITGMVRLARPRLTPRQVTRGRAAMARLTGPAAVAYRAGDPRTVPGRMRELGLTEEEALGAVAAFALTGTETLVSYVPRLVALATESGWLERVAADPSATDAVIAEAFRVTVPSPVMLRSVAAPATIGDTAVRPGERIVIATVSAARGGRPDFDPSRTPTPSIGGLWFGAGVHFCLGMPLALAEIRTLLDVLVAAAPLEIVRRRVARRVLIPAYRELVVRRHTPGADVTHAAACVRSALDV